MKGAGVEAAVVALDLVGTFVFALSGGMAGVRHRLDLFGVLVLAFAAATAGGITRDLMIGAIPPAPLADWRYVVVAVLAGLLTFFAPALLDRIRSPVLVFDAVGLSVFAVSGAFKALAFDLNPIAAVLLGVLTGTGGGIARDILVRRIPGVLRSELYAVAALAGASVVVAGDALGLPSALTVAVGGGACLALRLIAIRRGWRLPTARDPRPAAASQRLGRGKSERSD